MNKPIADLGESDLQNMPYTETRITLDDADRTLTIEAFLKADELLELVRTLIGRERR